MIANREAHIGYHARSSLGQIGFNHRQASPQRSKDCCSPLRTHQCFWLFLPSQGKGYIPSLNGYPTLEPSHSLLRTLTATIPCFPTQETFGQPKEERSFPFQSTFSRSLQGRQRNDAPQDLPRRCCSRANQVV